MIEIVRSNNSSVNAITHSGVFHADDVMTTAILHITGDIYLLRTFKVPEDLGEEVIVFDIGRGKYDHHQEDARRREDGHKYAACGLIWEDGYGKAAIRALHEDLTEDQVNFVYKEIEENLIRPIEEIDNGENENYHPLTLNQIVKSFYGNTEDENADFLEAELICESVLKAYIKRSADKIKQKDIVEEAIANSKGSLLILNKFVPWQQFLAESDNEKAKDILFVAFPSLRGGWNVQAVPVSPESFECKKPFPEEWRGKSADWFENAGIPATFCHASGFLCAVSNPEDAKCLISLF